MIEIKDKKQCSGCSACVSICKEKCISLISDEEGFAYPSVDEKKCIGCNMCEKVCPFITQNKPNELKRVVACMHEQEDIRLKSSSGGFFSALAQNVLSQDGVAFGAAVCEDGVVRHIAVQTPDELAALRGSKYVQSDVNDSFFECKRFLEDGKMVLFSGTPCQIKGLNKFLGKKYDKLLTVDFICHGVPSPLVWKRYIEKLSKRFASKVKSVSFRDKTYGWKVFSMVICFENGKKYVRKLTEDNYLRAFVANLILRPSCYVCKAKSGTSNSDYTMADFWGVLKYLPEMTDDKGVSMVIINTQKADALIQKLPLVIKEVDEGSIKSNPSYYYSSPMHKKRAKFFKKIQKDDIDKTIYDILKPNIVNKINLKVSKILKRK